jgi:hypothetical protein
MAASKFEMFINLNTAKALGLTVPDKLGSRSFHRPSPAEPSPAASSAPAQHGPARWRPRDHSPQHQSGPARSLPPCCAPSLKTDVAMP